MNRIATGIKVYFNSKSDRINHVVFSDNSQKTYDVGGMLFEVISDDSIYLLNDKVKNMINAFPNKQDSVSIDSIADYFKWLYHSIESEKLPVSANLFKSTFNEAIKQTLVNEEQMAEFHTIEDFFNFAYSLYFEHLSLFSVYVEAIAAEASKISDRFQHELAESFIEMANEYYDEYTRRCNSQQMPGNSLIDTIPITNFLQLLVFEYCRMKANRKAIKICANCGCFFIPKGRFDTLYCFLPAPGHPGKTCHDVGAHIKRQQNRKSDAYLQDYHRKTCNLYNIIRRAKKCNPEAVPYFKKQLEAMQNEYRERTQIKSDLERS